MLDKRPLLGSSDDDDIRHAKETVASGGVSFKANTAPHVLWYLRQIVQRRKLFLLLVGVFVCSYLIIGPANVLELDNIVQVHHRSGVQDMEGIVKLDDVDIVGKCGAVDKNFIEDITHSKQYLLQSSCVLMPFSLYSSLFSFVTFLGSPTACLCLS